VNQQPPDRQPTFVCCGQRQHTVVSSGGTRQPSPFLILLVLVLVPRPRNRTLNLELSTNEGPACWVVLERNRDRSLVFRRRRDNDRTKGSKPKNVMNDASCQPTPDRLMQMAWGFAAPLILQAATSLRLLDSLEGGPQTAGALARSQGLPVRGVTILLDSLVGLQFLRKQSERYVLTPESEAFLVSTSPRFHGPYLDHMCAQLLPQWLRLSEVVRAGRPVASTNAEEDGGEHFARFVESLFPLGEPLAMAVAEHLGLMGSPAQLSVLDLGAGSGVWGITLARYCPGARVRAVDFDRVLQITRAQAGRHGVADRITTIAGDFLEADLGRDHDLATLGHVLHSEGPERVRRLLQRVRASLRPGGRVVITEFVPSDDRTGPAQPLIFAVNMLVNTEGGNTYTEGELFGWLKEAGFTSPYVLPSPGPATVILAEVGGKTANDTSDTNGS
jgi:3-hydroxy-5-methyl-1-naphthoate 3-O-methyltransferase